MTRKIPYGMCALLGSLIGILIGMMVTLGLYTARQYEGLNISGGALWDTLIITAIIFGCLTTIIVRKKGYTES